jgi:hypothetical protein
LNAKKRKIGPFNVNERLWDRLDHDCEKWRPVLRVDHGSQRKQACMLQWKRSRVSVPMSDPPQSARHR